MLHVVLGLVYYTVLVVVVTFEIVVICDMDSAVTIVTIGNAPHGFASHVRLWCTIRFP